MSEVSLNLSGVWQGRYDYPGAAQPPVSFIARLTEVNGWLNGDTEERGSMPGDGRGALIATLQGRRTDRNVTWLKLYHRAPRHYDAVRYEGDVSADGLEISGRWTIPGAWSGTFLMIRPRADAVKTTAKAEERA